MSFFDRLTPFLPHRSVRARFAWVTGASGVLFAVLLAFWVAQDQRQQLQEAVSASARREAQVMGQMVSTALAERQSQIQQLASQPEVASGLMDAGALRLLLERTRVAHPEFEWLAMVDARGLITTATGARLEGTDAAGAKWFVQGRQDPWLGEPHVAGALAPFLPPDTDGRLPQLIDMATPVIDYEGKTIGVLVGMLNWGWIRSMHSDLIAQNAGLQHALLLTPSGEVVIGPVALLGKTLKPDGFDAVRTGGPAQVLDWPDQGALLSAVAPVRWSTSPDQASWNMVTRQDPQLVFGRAERLWQRMLLGGLLASLVFMCLSWWLAGRIAAPLRALARTATALQQGQAAQFDVVTDQADEIAALSQALCDMHDKLQLRMSELAAHRDELEARVTQRTEQLRQALDKAEAATRAKSAFIANMSHEIRTPMNAIMGTTYLMQQSALQPGQAERLQTIEQAARHLLQIINDILDLSKIEAGMFTLVSEDFDLDALLQGALALVADRARDKQVALSVTHEGCPARLCGDATRLSQILINLLSNAVKFTERGEVSLLLSMDAIGPDQLSLRVEVHDTGVGIAADKVDSLFNAFVQADESTTRRFGGTGLGLAITRSLVELMGGQIGVRSVLGQGSVFWCTLNLQAAQTQVSEPVGHVMRADEAAERLRRQHAGAQVLLAEDNPINSMLGMELLAMVGVVATPAMNGVEAVELARQRRFDLILMDVHMPEMDGLTATRTIRSLPSGGDVPIIAMTASVLQAEREACQAAGMNAHLAKPIDTQALFQTLLQWLPPSADGAKHAD